MEKIKLDKPFAFEGKEYTEIDLSGLEKMTVQDAIDTQKATAGEGGAALLLSANMAFAMRLAASAANEPVEFFKLLPMKAANQVKTAVMNAMNGEAQADGKKLVLEKPAAYKDKQYKEIEFTGAAELCAMDMMKAENEIAAKGFATPLPQTNILYCCLIAARASGMDKEFFTGLPLCETVKIRNVVNSEDFFG